MATAKALCTFIGWKNVNSMEPYMRFAASSQFNITALTEHEEFATGIQVINASNKELNTNIESSNLIVGATNHMSFDELNNFIYNNGFVAEQKEKRWKNPIQIKQTTDIMRVYYLLKENAFEEYKKNRREKRKKKYLGHCLEQCLLEKS